MKQSYFEKNYPGPRGPHLNCKTHRTITGENAPIDKQVSIHPGKFLAGKTVRRGGDN